MLKRIISIFAITLIITGAFFEGYSVRCPSFGATWENCDTLQEQTDAFIAYCKSRDLTIESSIADALTSFTTKAYQSAVNALGININAIQSDIKRATDGNVGYKYLFTVTGADAMNRIFAQFLQDHELTVGDEVNNEVVDSAYYFTDLDGYTCKVYIVPAVDEWIDSSNFSSIVYGSKYRYDGYDLFNKYVSDPYTAYPKTQLSSTFNFNSSKNNYVCKYYVASVYYSSSARYENSVSFGSSVSSGTLLDRYMSSSTEVNNLVRDGELCIFVQNGTSNMYFGGRTNDKQNNRMYFYSLFKFNNNSGYRSGDVYINSPTINNNTYNNNTYTVINNEGDVYNYDTNDEPDPNPPVVPDPDPDPPNPDPPSGNGWDDFQLPEMPNDWLIYGMENKFPFDIPFNIMFALSLLNHDPVTPRFTGDIDLKVCTWHYDIDLSPFDDIAAMVRKFEVLAFIIGLAIMTHNLINWG